MANGHGGRREGAGRPLGGMGPRAMKAFEAIESRFPDWSPLWHLAVTANDTALPADIRLDAARAALPFWHPRPKPIEMSPDDTIAFEAALAAAKAAATLKEIGNASDDLGDRLLRALTRTEALTAPPVPPATVQHAIIDAAPVPEPRVSRAEPSRGHPLPAGLQGDWTRPEAIYEPPQRQAFVDHDYENAPGTLLSSRDWE